jgi:hypothetical protein
VSPVRYELGSYIPEDGILHSHCSDNLKSNIALYECHWNLVKRGSIEFLQMRRDVIILHFIPQGNIYTYRSGINRNLELIPDDIPGVEVNIPAARTQYTYCYFFLFPRLQIHIDFSSEH